MNFNDKEYTMKDYTNYLQTVKWKKLRQEAFVRSKYKCEACGENYRLRTHHKKYPDVLGEEKLGDLVVLCYNCHELAHTMSSQQPRDRNFNGMALGESSLHGKPKIFTRDEILEYEKNLTKNNN